jgi:hypothetical protein
LTFALNRANSVYLCVFAGFVIGIWVILDLGSAYLTAPRDLSGHWRVVDAPAADGSPAAFTVTQSGRYLRFAFDQGPRFDAVLTQADGNNLNFRGQDWTVTGTGSPYGDTLNFKFQPPSHSGASPPSGTYQRQRMGQEDVTPLQLTARQPPPSPPNAVH